MKNIFESYLKNMVTDKKRRRITIAVFVPFLAAAMLLAALFSLQHAFTTGYTADLSQVIKTVSITQPDGQPVSGGYVLGQNYLIQMTFQETDSYQLKANEENVLTYQLPPEIEILQEVTDKPIYAAAPNDQKELGKYSIGLDGLVTVTFYNVDNTGTPTFDDGTGKTTYTDTGTPLPFYDNYIDAFFNLDVEAQFSSAGDNTQIKFGDTVTIPVTITEKPTEAALAITKSASPTFNNGHKNSSGDSAVDFIPSVNNNWKVTYTSVITATKGTVTSLTFHDDAAGFSWAADKSWLESVQVSIDGGAPVTYTLATAAQGTNTPGTYYWVSATKGTYNDPVSDPNAGFYLVFPSGAALDEGQDITVTYVIDAEKMLLAAGQDPYHFSYGYYLNNNAYASGKDGAGKQMDVSAKSSVFAFYRNFTPKSGVLSADGKTVAWTASVGDGYTLLTGNSIKDTLQNNTMSFGTPITIKLYGADHTIQIGPDITLPTPSGQNFSYDVTTPGVYYADITYTTNVTDLTAAAYYNSIYFTVNGKDYGYQAGITNPNADMKIAKTALVTDVDGYRAIQWTVKWSVPAAYCGHSVYLYDWLQGASSGYTNIPQHFTVNVTSGGTDLGKIAANDPNNGWLMVNSSDNLNFYFYFSPGGVNPGLPYTINGTPNVYQPKTDEQSLFPFKDGADVTITYYTMLEGPNASTFVGPAGGNTYPGSKPGDTLMAAMMDPTLTGYPKDVENMANMWGYITSAKTGYAWVGVSAPIAKTGTPDSSGQYIDYRVDIKSQIGSSSGAIISSFDMGDDPVFTDTFDSDTLAYVANSFYIMTYPNNISIGYFGPYDSSKQDQLITGGSLSNYIHDNGNGTSTITIHLKDLAQITGPATSYSNYTTAAPWIGPPTGVYTYPYPVNPAVPIDWWSAKNLWTSQPMIRVFYRLQLKADDEPGEHEVYNKAAINTLWTADNKSTVGQKVVTKTMVKDDATGNTVNAQIVINPLGQTIAPDSINGLYEAKDTMSAPLTLYLSSVKVEKQDPVGGAWQTVTLNNDYGTAWSYLFSSADNSIKFMFPDNTPIRITYNALVAGALGKTVNDVSNTITVAVKYSASDTVDFVVTGSNAGAGGSKLPVTLLKRDAADPDLELGGARFALYMNKSYPTLPAAPGGIDGAVAIPPSGGQTFYYVTDGYTDENGQLVFDDQHLSYSTGAVYALVELQAPNGYALPDDTVTLFALQDQDFSALTPKTVAVISDYITVTNTKNTFDFDFTKTDQNGQPLTGASFALYNAADATAPIAETKSGADGLVSFADLPAGDYTLTETASLPGYQLPTGNWLIHIGSEGGIVITAQGGSLTPAFKVSTDGAGNKTYSLPNYPGEVLPLTGTSVTPALLYEIGAGITAIALGGIGLFVIRRKKRLQNL